MIPVCDSPLNPLIINRRDPILKTAQGWCLAEPARGGAFGFQTSTVAALLALSKILNFAKAARTVYLSHPTLTFQIKLLEDSPGAKLFERRRQRVSLADAGFAFRDYAESMVSASLPTSWIPILREASNLAVGPAEPLLTG